MTPIDTMRHATPTKNHCGSIPGKTIHIATVPKNITNVHIVRYLKSSTIRPIRTKFFFVDSK